MPVADLLPELVLLIGAAVIIVTAAFLPHRLHGLCALLATGVLVASAGLVVTGWSRPDHLTFAGVWALDGAARFAKLLIISSGVASAALSPHWMATDRRHGEYYGLLLFAVLGAIMMASAADTMELVVGVLLSSVTGYALVGYHRQWSPAQEAAMKYFLVGALANALLVIGVVLLFGLTGATGYTEMAGRLAENPDPWVVITALVLILIGLGFKLGASPAHMWMPDVAQGAPAPVAALVTVITKVGAAVALARLAAVLPEAIPWRWAIALMAVVTMTWGNLAALWQSNLRRLLGWSAISQSGYALVAIAVLGATEQALPALMVILTAYAIANLAAFSVVTHLRGRTELADYRGLAQQRPWAAAVLILALLSFLGLPPLVGFFGKLLVFGAAIDGGYTWLAVAAVINTVVSLFYYLRVIAPMVFGTPEDTSAQLGWPSAVTMVITGLMVVFLGLGIESLIGLARDGTLLLLR
ncbi:NADH-quinone oxidoreductase subunit N [Marinobacter nanhaiticus D15-8W]|uniref:NADH-quinone oxidoreductase subunit N n=1 Tax=Marinobacter nanhaiticus D15-8W TaxID=626887 RepID=N6WY00_9GAMM|nr:NADH-quinone oxidoreductase subunit N [Marinobacter nanhaiticus]ENO16481.1 NADH-quinone oxidoreductase subunit N [Marinobacter nanhaiticus D15-8W]BES72270.1 NADH-quinone oxidoreductase subunit N [Marinobacter nanhaiticus D15-8W]